MPIFYDLHDPGFRDDPTASLRSSQCTRDTGQSHGACGQLMDSPDPTRVKASMFKVSPERTADTASRQTTRES